MSNLPRKDSKVVPRMDIRTVMRVMHRIADRALEDDAFGKELAKVIYPNNSTDLYVIYDTFAQIIGDRKL